MVTLGSSFLLLLSFISVCGVTAVCPLCENYAIPPRLSFKVDRFGKSCQDVLLEWGEISQNSGRCRNNIRDTPYRDWCCGANEPPAIVQAPTAAPGTLAPGPEPNCNICRDGEFPGRPSGVITILQMGTQSCRQLYALGNSGRIIDRLCLPLQDFAQEPCGCGQYNPNPGGSNSGNSGKLTKAPAPSPTRRPTGGNNNGNGSGTVSVNQMRRSSRRRRRRKTTSKLSRGRGGGGGTRNGRRLEVKGVSSSSS